MDLQEIFDRFLQLQRYIRWSDYDVQRVRAAGRIVQPYFARIVDDFYRRVDEHQYTRSFITGGRKQVRRLKESLRQWLSDLFQGRYDQSYVERRWRIGWRHVEIGLDHLHADAAYSCIREGLLSGLVEGWTGDEDDLTKTIGSLNRLLDLDLAIIQLAYHTEFIRRQETTKALKVSEERLRAIVNTCVDAIISVFEDGTIETFNPAAEHMFGYTRQEVIGRNVSLLMPSPYREEHDEYIQNYLQTGHAKIIGIGREVLGLRKDGSTFPIDLAVNQIDHLGMFIGIIRDISERKRTEQRLLQSERLAAIGQMIAGLAHESRNAFQRSQAALELLELEVEDNDEAQELIARIQRAQDHLHYLYEEVRDYAAPIRLSKRARDVSQIWRETWGHLEAMRRDKNVSLQESPSTANLVCAVDAQAMEQLFRNILENAIVACSEPGRITIRCADTQLDGEAALRISIFDNGPGLAKDAQQRVFEPFFTTKTQGTGLGMAIASRIAEAHKGKIEVANLPDSGAEFVVTLPRR